MEIRQPPILSGMAYIDTIHESDAKGRLADLYHRFGNPDGTVDNVMKVHSLNPESLEAHGALYIQAMHRPSPVTRAEREMIGVVVSRLNRCDYCQVHHAAGLRRLLPPERSSLADTLANGRPNGLTERESAIVNLARQLTNEPAAMRAGNMNDARAAGLSDREILDVIQTAAYFAYANRIVLGLGAEVEGTDKIGQWPDTENQSCPKR
ncbi:MAG: peroxidase-related enzyme [Planctomycetota bacterium]|nr:peroxidase-related enzyme [Planctomycetota bacterium]